MPDTLYSVWIHYVFSTKNRDSWLVPAIDFLSEMTKDKFIAGTAAALMALNAEIGREYEKELLPHPSPCA